MYRVIIILFLIGISFQAKPHASSGGHLTVETTLVKANKKNLPDSFVMLYTDLHGNSHYVKWSRSTLEILPQTVRLVNDGHVTHQSIDRPITYTGFIMKTHRSLASLTIYSDHTEMMLSSQVTGNVFVSKVRNKKVQYANESPYLKQNLQATTCSPDLQHFESPSLLMRSADASCKKVYVSITADYDLYLKKNRNVNQVINYLTGVMNNVMAIYRLEEIQIGISEVIIHQSPDAFRHLTALDDLNIFRFIRSSYDGHIALCLSGYEDPSGHAPLGGHAFVNALCNRSYSYAYVNVDGGYRSYPDYSWDIFGVTHELGHVMGSPHTHSCAWGPGGNETLDNCAPPEGACNEGPPVADGTIMSYCHLPGGPGINFAAGFGDEPGDLIRSKVASSGCLATYIPNHMPAPVAGQIRANRSCHDGQYTHYYYDNNTIIEDDDVLLMSIDADGQNIGSLHDGTLTVESRYGQNVTSHQASEISAEYVPSGTEYFVMNKYWKVSSVYQPNRNVTIRLPFLNRDMEEVDNRIPGGVEMEDLKAFRMAAPATADPDQNHRYATTARYHEMNMAGTAGTTTWKHTSSGGIHFAEFKTTTLHEYGMGAYNLQVLPVELVEFRGMRQSDEVCLLEWKAESELNLWYYSVEKSNNGHDFFEIDRVYSNDQKTYTWTESEDAAIYYRLNIIDKDRSQAYSKVVYLPASGARPEIYFLNNPVGNGQLYISTSSSTDELHLAIYSPLGQLVLETELSAGDQHAIDVDHLPSGYYIADVQGSGLSHQETLIITGD